MLKVTSDWIKKNTTGVILAGGQGRRMGGQNKGLLKINKQTMVEYILARIKNQVGPILINANDQVALYRHYGYPVIGDTVDGFQGPVAGMLAAAEHCRTPWLCTVPCDSPLLADDLLLRLHQARADDAAELAVANDGKRIHPVFCLMRSDLRDHIRHVLARGERKIESLFIGIKTVQADFSDKPECFLNINRPEDLVAMKELIGQTNNFSH